MKVIVASKSGFCFGVKKAVRTAIKASKEYGGRKIYTYGPIIHNNQVTEYLSQLGVDIVENLEMVAGEVVIIRSHGVPLGFYDEARQLGIQIIDTTCPYVKKVQKLANEYYLKGYQIVILGDAEHPEVVGINGWADFKAIVLSDASKLDSLKEYSKVCFLAQTTLALTTWIELEKKVLSLAGNIKLFNTICSATEERQKETEKLAELVDLMIVIGGKHSSNTQKLYKIAAQRCTNTIHIESAAELMMNLKGKYGKIGIAAGASTPDWIIKEVIEQLENEGEVIING